MLLSKLSFLENALCIWQLSGYIIHLRCSKITLPSEFSPRGLGSKDSLPLRRSCIIFYADVKFYDLQNQITNTKLCLKLGRRADFFFRCGAGYLFWVAWVAFRLTHTSGSWGRPEPEWWRGESFCKTCFLLSLKLPNSL